MGEKSAKQRASERERESRDEQICVEIIIQGIDSETKNILVQGE